MFIIASVLIVFLLGLVYLAYRLTVIPDAGNLELSIDHEINKLMRGSHIPGVVVGVYKHGRSYIKGFGTINKDVSQPPDADTVFQIGSITKIFTASLLQCLCEEGRVSMNDTLEELIGKKVLLSTSAKKITLKQLVTHRSGLPRVPRPLLEKVTRLAGKDQFLVDPYRHIVLQDVFDYLAQPEGLKKPGTFEYSNFGMGLLAHVLELVMETDYESLVREKILQPISMNDSAITLSSKMKSRLAQGYTAKGNPNSAWTFHALAGAGAYASTVKDMLAFIQASIDGNELASRRLLSMSVPQFGGKSGIGWMQASTLDYFLGNKDIVWHNGMVGGYASYLAIDKKSGSGVVLLSNQASSLDMYGMMLMRLARSQSWERSKSPVIL